MWARAYAVFPNAYDKSRAPKAKKVRDGKKQQKTCVHHVHVSEYVLNSMFQGGYSRTLVLF